MKYDIVLTTSFKKELKIIKKRNKDLLKLKEVVNILASDEELPPKYKDHILLNTSSSFLNSEAISFIK